MEGPYKPSGESALAVLLKRFSRPVKALAQLVHTGHSHTRRGERRHRGVSQLSLPGPSRRLLAAQDYACMPEYYAVSIHRLASRTAQPSPEGWVGWAKAVGFQGRDTWQR